MRLSRCIFAISNVLTILALLKLHSFSNKVFTADPGFLNPTHKILFIDNHFSDNEIEIIKESANEWSNKTHNIIKFDIEKMPSKKHLNLNNDVLIIPVTSNFPDIIITDKFYDCDCTLGFYNNKGPINFIEIATDRISDNNYKNVVLHEIGHSVGLTHNNNIGTLMYPTVQFTADYITEDDLVEFCKLYKCDPKKLRD